MKMSLRELAEARAALACFFERIWPDPDCPRAEEPLDRHEFTLHELEAREQRYRQALCTVNTLRQSELKHSETKHSEMTHTRTD